MPLYKDVKRRLTDALHQGTWRHGQMLPPEPALAERFGASVGTLRRAVGELVGEGILVRRQGSGTFVASHTRDVMLTRFFRIVDRDGNKRFPQSQTLSFRRTHADAASAEALQIARRCPILQIEALLSLDGEPVILDRIRLPAALFPDMTREVFSERDTRSMRSTSRATTSPSCASRNRSPRRSPTRGCARCFASPTRHPVLRIARTAYAHRDVPVDTRVRYVSTRTTVT